MKNKTNGSDSYPIFKKKYLLKVNQMRSNLQEHQGKFRHTKPDKLHS